MKILQLCKKFPFPLKDGESIAITNLSSALSKLGCEMTLLAMNTSKHYFDGTVFPTPLQHYKAIHNVDIDNRINITDAFMNLFSDESYHISRFISKEFESKLIQLLQSNSYDIVQLETLYLAPYIDTIRKYSKAKIAMRAHNVEHEIWERITQNTNSAPRKWYLNHLTKKLKKYEQAQLNKYDLLIPITARDLDIFKSFGFKKQSIVSPIGLDGSAYHENNKSFKRDISLSFIGSLDWKPNIEGLEWFLKNVWDKLHQDNPTLQLHVAGRNTPDWLLNKKIPNVIMHGEIEDASEFINKHSVMIVPLLSGSGMRAKILEGMALGKVVLTTSLGLEGIDAQHLKNVLVADTPAEFSKCLNWAYNQNGQLQTLGANAQKFVNTEYDNLSIGENLLNAYQSFYPTASRKKVRGII